jgi:hypothetical protein
MNENNQFEKLESAMTKIMAVSHEELKRRETEWKKQRKQVKKQKRKSVSA